MSGLFIDFLHFIFGEIHCDPTDKINTFLKKTLFFFFIKYIVKNKNIFLFFKIFYSSFFKNIFIKRLIVILILKFIDISIDDNIVITSHSNLKGLLRKN